MQAICGANVAMQIETVFLWLDEAAHRLPSLPLTIPVNHFAVHTEVHKCFEGSTDRRVRSFATIRNFLRTLRMQKFRGVVFGDIEGKLRIEALPPRAVLATMRAKMPQRNLNIRELISRAINLWQRNSRRSHDSGYLQNCGIFFVGQRANRQASVLQEFYLFEQLAMTQFRERHLAR